MTRASRASSRRRRRRAIGNRTTPNRLDFATGIQSGGPQGFGALRLVRTTIAASVTEYRSFLSVDHEMKFGAQVEDGAHATWTAFQGGVVSYTDKGGQPVQAVFRQPSTTGGEFVTTGVYAMDTIRIGDRLTANLGLRFDHDRAISPDLPAHDAQGSETGATVAGLGTLYSWNVFSPRLGLTAKLTADGRTVARASYGRFHQGILSGELAPVHPGLTAVTTAAFDPATGDYSRVISVVDPTINLRVDPNTTSPLTDQIGVGVERELTRGVTAGASYVRKNGSRFIGWTDTGGQYAADTRTLPDGETVPVLVLTNGTAARRFLLTNQPDYFMRYNGVVATIEKRWSGSSQLLFFVHAVKNRRAGGVERRPGGVGAIQLHVRQRQHIRPRPQLAHERHRRPAKRSHARRSRHGIGRDPENRRPRRRERPVPHGASMGGFRAGHAAARAQSNSARNAWNEAAARANTCRPPALARHQAAG